MELVHKLNGVTIEEPIGFDSFETKIERGKYHGMSVAVTVNKLEFYREAFSIIKAAYDADIDTVVQYEVIAGNRQFYAGVVDLSTCEFQEAEYKSVSCNIGEIGVKTTFNNRTETEVNVGNIRTIDGTLIPTGKRAPFYTLYLPTKQLVYTNRFSESKDTYVTNPNNPSGWFNVISRPARYSFLLDTNDKNEFGSINVEDENESLYHVGEQEELEAFRKKYGTNCKYALSGSIKATLHYSLTLKNGWHWVESYGTPPASSTFYDVLSRSRIKSFRARFVGNGQIWKDEDGEIYHDVYAWNSEGFAGDAAIVFGVGGNVEEFVPSSMSGTYTSDIEVSVEDIDAENAYSPQFVFGADFNVYSSQLVYFRIAQGSELRMKMYDTIKLGSTAILAVSVGDALFHTCQAISENELTFKSDWLALPDSPQSAGRYGGGALKFITSGYGIRNIYIDGRGVKVSFKSIIEALSALDCIGWGFANEDGQTVVRVERWNWFYTNDVILSIAGASNVKKTIDSSLVVTQFNVGYKKYATTSDYDSIDSIHGERTFVSSIKAVRGELTKTCEWIADNYAIEETRRAQKSIDRSEEFKYDENIFVLECMKRSAYNFEIAKSAHDVSGLDRPDELINAMLSPRHMAARWKDFLFACNSSSDLRFQTGKVNYDASFGVNQSSGTTVYLDSFADSSIQKEDDNISNQRAMFTAEAVTFEYPISAEQFNGIMNNPYGLVVVNGQKGWIKELSYSPTDGMAKFKLIKKYE